MEQQFLDQYHQCKTRFVAKEFDDLDHEDLKVNRTGFVGESIF